MNVVHAPAADFLAAAWAQCSPWTFTKAFFAHRHLDPPKKNPARPVTREQDHGSFSVSANRADRAEITGYGLWTITLPLMLAT